MLFPLHTLTLFLAMLIPAAAPSTEAPAPGTLNAAVMPANSHLWVGSVNGLNTVDYTSSVFLTDLDYWDWEVTASGNGNNKLTVKLQQKLNTGWTDAEVFELKPGQKKTGWFRVVNATSGTEEHRWRLSRKIGTKKISYTVSMIKRL